MTAWGDVILPGLRPRARAIYAVGRFKEVSEGRAVFVLPNAAHVEHAAALRDEVASAIAGHFGARVGLEIVPDAPPAAPPGTEAVESPKEAEEPSVDLGEADPAAGSHDSASWAESRLKEVFPGAEEVTG